MKSISLIEVFENKPFQDVGTFNSIFKQTPIMGYPFNASVEIKELHAGDKRRIVIGDNNDEIFLKIVQAKPKPRPKKKEYEYILKKEIAATAPVSLPDMFKTLKPSEFMVFQAIKLLGFIDSTEELSKHLNICGKTIRSAVKKLTKLNMISADKVAVNGKPMLRLGLTRQTIDGNMFLQ